MLVFKTMRMIKKDSHNYQVNNESGEHMPKKKTINSFATLLDFQANMYHSMKLCNNTHEMGTFAKKNTIVVGLA